MIHRKEAQSTNLNKLKIQHGLSFHNLFSDEDEINHDFSSKKYSLFSTKTL